MEFKLAAVVFDSRFYTVVLKDLKALTRKVTGTKDGGNVLTNDGIFGRPTLLPAVAN